MTIKNFADLQSLLQSKNSNFYDISIIGYKNCTLVDFSVLSKFDTYSLKCCCGIWSLKKFTRVILLQFSNDSIRLVQYLQWIQVLDLLKKWIQNATTLFYPFDQQENSMQLTILVTISWICF